MDNPWPTLHTFTPELYREAFRREISGVSNAGELSSQCDRPYTHRLGAKPDIGMHGILEKHASLARPPG